MARCVYICDEAVSRRPSLQLIEKCVGDARTICACMLEGYHHRYHRHIVFPKFMFGATRCIELIRLLLHPHLGGIGIERLNRRCRLSTRGRTLRPTRVNGALWVPQPSPQYGEMHTMQTKNKQPPVGVRSQDNPPAAPAPQRQSDWRRWTCTVPIRYETSKERQACNLFAQIPLQVTEV
jgi:hypothetical protein